MAKKEKPRAGRFVHIDFPTEGVSRSADVAFNLSKMHALALELNVACDAKVTWSEMIEDEPPKPNVLRLVK